MPTPAEQAAVEPVAGSQGAAEAPTDPNLEDTRPIPVVPAPDPTPGTDAAPDPGTDATPDPGTDATPVTSATPGADATPGAGAGKEPERSRRAPNGAATASLIAGILGVTGIGVLLGLAFGAVGLVRSRRVHVGKVRCWTGIILSLLWAGGFGYVVPHVIKASDPGCTWFKEKVLPHYNQAIEDLDTRAASNKTTADLAIAVAGLTSASAKARNPQARTALRALTSQLKKASNDQIGGQIPASVMLTLNHDAVAADNACGTM